jgi:hypothetical protein
MGIVNIVISNAVQGMVTATWSGLTGGDTGQPLVYSNMADKTVQAFGTIGAAITIEGSNDPNVLANPGSAVWSPLSDFLGDAISFSANGISLISEAPLYIRPNCAAGTTNATVIILANVS